MREGDPSCPCIDPWANGDFETVATESSGNASCLLSRSGVCYGDEYGARGCRDYDLSATPDCFGLSPPTWCSSYWCYVDRSCAQTSEASTFFAHTTYGSGLLRYSYQTCGFEDDFTTESTWQRVQESGPTKTSRAQLQTDNKYYIKQPDIKYFFYPFDKQSIEVRACNSI